MDTEQPPRFTYQKVHRYLSDWLDARAPGQSHRLPSLRDVARQLQVSLTSCKQAFALLEAQGRVHARPKVGYFSVIQAPHAVLPSTASLLDRVFASARQPGMLALSSDSPPLLGSLDGPLLMLERDLVRRSPKANLPPYLPLGEPQLREAVARHYSRGMDHLWQADQVFVGPDLRSVLDLALAALVPRGSLALVESPCSWLVLRQLQAAGLHVVEVPLNREGRLDLEAIARLLTATPVRVAVFSSRVNVPQGGAMPAADKQRLCELLTEHQVWLFENDSYGGLCPRQPACRDYADPLRLLVFASFDKHIGAEAPFAYLLCRGAAATLAEAFYARGVRLPGYRQRAIAQLFGSGRVERHQASLARKLTASATRMVALMKSHAADCLHLSMPVAGASLWLQATRPVDMDAVCEQLLAQGIVIAPGSLFSQAGHWRDHLRLSVTVDWQQNIEGALIALAQAISRAPQLP